MAQREHGVPYAYTFVKRLLQAAKLLPTRRPRGRHRRRREPRPCFGEMLHLDGSPHAWLALQPQATQVLIAVVDDATTRVLVAALWPAETTVAIMTTSTFGDCSVFSTESVNSQPLLWLASLAARSKLRSQATVTAPGGKLFNRF